MITLTLTSTRDNCVRLFIRTQACPFCGEGVPQDDAGVTCRDCGFIVTTSELARHESAVTCQV